MCSTHWVTWTKVSKSMSLISWHRVHFTKCALFSLSQLQMTLYAEIIMHFWALTARFQSRMKCAGRGPDYDRHPSRWHLMVGYICGLLVLSRMRPLEQRHLPGTGPAWSGSPSITELTSKGGCGSHPDGREVSYPVLGCVCADTAVRRMIQTEKRMDSVLLDADIRIYSRHTRWSALPPRRHQQIIDNAFK